MVEFSFEKQFKCEDCGKEFTQKSKFTQHRRTHTGKIHTDEHESCMSHTDEHDVLSCDESSTSSPADQESLVDEFVEDFMSDFDERFISSLFDDLVAQSLNDAYADYMLAGTTHLVNSEEMLKRITFQGDSTAQTFGNFSTNTDFVPDLQFKCEIDQIKD